MSNNLSKEKFEELKNLATPLQDWMMENFNVQCKIEITCDFVSMLAPEIGVPLVSKFID